MVPEGKRKAQVEGGLKIDHLAVARLQVVQRPSDCQQLLTFLGFKNVGSHDLEHLAYRGTTDVSLVLHVQ